MYSVKPTVLILTYNNNTVNVNNTDKDTAEYIYADITDVNNSFSKEKYGNTDVLFLFESLFPAGLIEKFIHRHKSVVSESKPVIIFLENQKFLTEREKYYQLGFDFVLTDPAPGKEIKNILKTIVPSPPLKNIRINRLDELELYKMIFENSSAGIAVYTRQERFRLKYCNNEFKNLTRYESDDLIETAPADITFPEDKLHYENLLRQLISCEKKKIQFEKRIMRKDGTFFWAEVSYSCLRQNENESLILICIIEDISNLIKVKSDLEASQNRYRILAENLNELLFMTDPDGIVQYVSPAVTEMGGYLPDELTGKIFTEFVHPEFVATVLEQFSESKTGNKSIKEFIVFGKNGNEIWVRSSLNAVKINGKITSVMGLLADISDKKKIEIALQESEYKYRTIFNNAGDAIFIHNLKGRFLEMNKIALERYGYSPEELTCINARMLDVSPESDKLNKRIDELKNKGEIIFETVHITKSGKKIPSEISSKKITYENKEAVLSIARDITERIETKDALIVSEERFRQVADCAEEWIWEVDAEGMYTYSSPGIKSILGYGPDEITGKKYFYDFFTEAEKKDIKEKAFDIFGKHLPFRKFVNANRHKNGNIVYLETTGFPIVGKNNELLGYRGIDINITEKINFENEMKAALEKEYELNKLKSQFITTVSHEFRTPLTTINSSAEFLELIGLNEDKRANVHFIRIKNSVHRMKYLLEELLTVNKINKDKLNYSPVYFDFKKLIEVVQEETEQTLKSGQKLTITNNCSFTKCHSDPNLIRLILDNILNNAVKFSGEDKKINCYIECDKNNARVKVTDEGIGIPKDEITNIFGPFRRGSNVMFYPGTGLGLSIVQNAVDLLKGRISLTSKIDKGSTFNIVFPIIAEERAAI